MEIKIKALDSVNTLASTTVSADAIKSSVEKLAKKAAKTMKVDGFRQGHVPVAVVLKRYEKELTNDAEQDVLRDVVEEAIKQAGKKNDDLIGEPIVSKFDKKDDKIDVELTVSFKPSVDVSGYESLIPEFSSPRVLKKDIEVKFPENYGAAHLAGKDAVFKVKLHEIQERKIPEKLDEEMLKTILPNEEKPTEELLEERIKEQIRQEKIYKLINEELKPKFAEAAVEKFKFDVPKNIVEQEIDMQFRNAWSTFTPDDMKKFREDKDALAKKRDEYRKDAENSVRLTFIIDELARVRGVKVSDQEVVQAIYFEAYRSGQDPKAHLEMYRNQGMLPAIKMSMIEEKLFSELFNKEKDEKKASKKEKAE